MSTPQIIVDEPRLRVAEHDATTALRTVAGQPAVPARARLRFGPGRTCEPLARLLDRAIVRAEAAGLDPSVLVVAESTARAGEDIVRVRRRGYGPADWIASPTCQVRIVLLPAGLHAPAAPASPAPAPAPPAPHPPAPASPAPAPAPPAPHPPAPAASAPDPPAEAERVGQSTAAVRAALAEVIDPDLGVNIVDLGFVRAVAVQGRTAVITMTLTSAACPLTAVMESQIRAGLDALAGIDGFRVDWQWVPAWRPADMTDSGREQLRAIGFTI